MMDGVDVVQNVSFPRIVFRGRPITLVSVEIASIGRTARRKAIEGNEDDMYRLAGSGQGVIAADNLAQLENLHVGQMVEIATPTGILRLPIVGIVEDYSDQKGTFLVDREIYKRYWKDDSCQLFRVYVKKGVSPLAVRQHILDRFGSQSRLFVMTNEELRNYVLKITDQWFGMSYAQVFVAIVVA